MNGKLIPWDEARVHVLTHALHYGTGVFEGIKCYDTVKGPAIFRLQEHMQRLTSSAKIYRMPMPFSVDELCAAAEETVKVNNLKECYIRPIAFRGYGEMGVNPARNPMDVSIIVWKWGAYLGEEGMEKGIRTMISSWQRIDTRSLPTHAKACGHYMNSVLAKQEALDLGFDEAIMLNSHGMLCEGSGENLFIVKDGVLITPPPSAGALPGITRESAITIARDIGIDFVTRDIIREEIFLADEAFFTGTAAEITPIREVDGRAIGNNGRGEITKKIQTKYFDIVNGKDEKYHHWLGFI